MSLYLIEVKYFFKKKKKKKKKKKERKIGYLVSLGFVETKYCHSHLEAVIECQNKWHLKHKKNKTKIVKKNKKTGAKIIKTDKTLVDV